MKGKFLSSKELKQIRQLLDQQWGITEKPDYQFFMTEKGRIYIVSRDIAKLDLSLYRINSVGMYFGELKKELLRLSIEGSQLIGPKAKKNVLELNKDEMKAWLRGEDLDKEVEYRGFVIIKHGTDYIGSGKAVEGKILNFVPKARRLKTADMP